MNNNKNLAAQALLEMDAINESIKKQSEGTLKSLLAESVKDALRSSIEDDEYVILEAKKGTKKSIHEVGEQDAQDPTAAQSAPEAPEQGGQQMPDDAAMGGDAQAPAAGDEGMPQGQDAAPAEPEDGAEGEQPDQDMEQYKVDDNTYDLTGAKGDEVIKVFKKLKNDDQVVVKQNGGQIELNDNETGAEYVIDLGGDEEGVEDEGAPEEPAEDEAAEEPAEEGQEQLDEEYLYEFEDGEEQMPEPPSEFDLDLDDLDDIHDGDPRDREPYDDTIGRWSDKEDGEDDLDDIHDGDPRDREPYDDTIGRWSDKEDGEGDLDGDYIHDEFPFKDEESPLTSENKKSKKKTMKESKNDILFEVDLGYTDNYQSQDPITGLSMSEPSKSGKSWHKGIPTGTEKPWAGKGTDKKGDPFEKAVNEEFEEENIAGMPEENLEEGGSRTSVKKAHRVKSSAGDTDEKFGFPTRTPHSVNGELKNLTAENKQLKKAVGDLRGSLNEAYMTNVNLGKITKLFLENSTTKAEKVAIIERFTNEAKTAEQAQALYESINRQLKSNKTQTPATIAESKQPKSAVITEQKSKDLLDTIDFMNRVMSC